MYSIYLFQLLKVSAKKSLSHRKKMIFILPDFAERFTVFSEFNSKSFWLKSFSQFTLMFPEAIFGWFYNTLINSIINNQKIYQDIAKKMS